MVQNAPLRISTPIQHRCLADSILGIYLTTCTTRSEVSPVTKRASADADANQDRDASRPLEERRWFFGGVHMRPGIRVGA